MRIQGCQNITLLAGSQEDMEALQQPRNKQYAVALCGLSDELLVGVYDSEAEARRFVTENPPAPVRTQRRPVRGR